MRVFCEEKSEPSSERLVREIRQGKEREEKSTITITLRADEKKANLPLKYPIRLRGRRYQVLVHSIAMYLYVRGTMYEGLYLLPTST